MHVSGVSKPVSSSELRAGLIASARRALSGQRPAILREYSVACDTAAKRITLKAEVDRAPSPEEYDDLAAAESEIHADLGEEWQVETTVTVLAADALLSPLKDGVAYRRA